MSLQSLVSFCARRPFVTVGIWVLLMISSGLLSQNYLDSALSGGQGATQDQEFRLAQKLKDEKMNDLNPQQQSSGSSGMEDNLLVVTSNVYTFPSDEYFTSLNGFFNKIQSEIDKFEVDQNIGKVEDYQINPSQDGTTIMISAPFVRGELVGPLIHVTEDFSDDNFQYYFIGFESIQYSFAHIAEKDLITGETIGISVALIILALVFGSVTSAIIPVILAVVAIFVSIGAVSVIGQIVDLNDFVPNIMTMMGLAVGIDYCLFILSRYREERANGFEKYDAIINSGSTAGRAVLFSGLTVVLALVGMFIIPEKTFQAFGVGAIVVVFVAVMAGITILPAIIGILGDRVNSFGVPKGLTIILYIIGFLIVAFTQDLGPILLLVSVAVMSLLILLSILKKRGLNISFFNPDKSSETEGGFLESNYSSSNEKAIYQYVYCSRLSNNTFLFYFDLEKGTSGISVLPDDEPVKVGFNLLDEKFGFGSNAPATIMIDADMNSEKITSSINKIEQSLIEDAGFLPPEVLIEPSVNFAELTSMIPGDPQNQISLNSIKRLRNEIIPSAFDGIPSSEYTIYVGGQSAEVVDSVEMTDEYFPIVLGLVLSLSLVLLLFAFRSITISIASIIMNLLSVGASYGLLVLVFQKGFMIDIFGFEQVDQLEFWLPLFMFSILFGLSMDYHVFMLSRIKEHFDETGSSDESVAFGLRKTASIITGAALIMVAVFGGFALGELAFFQSMGFGLGAAVLIDATVVRSILVPSVMKLLGTNAWYLPKFLNWLPNISIEGNVNKN